MRAAACHAVATILLLSPASARAQETRTEIIRQEQTDKLRTVTAPEPNRAEKIVNRLEDWGWLTGEPRGVYPLLDSVYPGGGFAAGLGARKPFGDDGAISAIGAYSINGFWRARTDVTLPSFASNRGRVSFDGRLPGRARREVRRHRPGLRKDHKTTFGYTPFEGGGRLDFDVSRYSPWAAASTTSTSQTNSGATGPSIEERFSPADSPGLERDQFKYVNSTARAVVDWRRQLGYAGSGGLYRVQFDDFREKDNEQYSFRSLEAEVTQLIPLMRANWVIALRGLTTITDIDETAAVPYFMLPSVGGGQDPSGISGLPLPRSPSPGHERGAAVDPRALPRHGGFLRRREGGGTEEATSISAISRSRTGSACGSLV